MITERGRSLLLSNLLLKDLPSARQTFLTHPFRQVQTPGSRAPTGKQPRSLAKTSLQGFWGGWVGIRSLSDLFGGAVYPEQCNNPCGCGAVSLSFLPSVGEDEVVPGGLSPCHLRHR